MLYNFKLSSTYLTNDFDIIFTFSFYKGYNMKKFQKLIKILFFLSFFLEEPIFASNIINPKSIDKVEKAIVNIETRIAVSAYLDPGSWRGTGFITDKENGLVVTNNHVVGGASIGTYFLP